MTTFDRVAEFRRTQGLSQLQLSQTVGLSPATIANIESGKTNPNSTSVKKIAAALNVHPLQLSSEIPLERVELAILSEIELCEVMLESDEEIEERKLLSMERKLRRMELQLAAVKREASQKDRLQSTQPQKNHPQREQREEEQPQKLKPPVADKEEQKEPVKEAKEVVIKEKPLPVEKKPEKKPIKKPVSKEEPTEPSKESTGEEEQEADLFSKDELHVLFDGLPGKVDDESTAQEVLAAFMKWAQTHDIPVNDALVAKLVKLYLERRITRNQRARTRKLLLAQFDDQPAS